MGSVDVVANTDTRHVNACIWHRVLSIIMSFLVWKGREIVIASCYLFIYSLKLCSIVLRVILRIKIMN